MNSLECLTARCLMGINWWMCLVSLPPRTEQLWLLLALIIRCIWLAYHLAMLWTICYFLSINDKFNIGFVSGSALYIGYSLLGLLIQVESMCKYRTYVQLEDLRFQLKLQMQRLGMSRGCRRSKRLLLILGTQIACDMIKFWANTQYSSDPLHYIATPQKCLLRFRYIQLIWELMELHQRTLQLRHSVLSLAAGNDIWQPYAKDEDWQQLQALRICYDRIYESYESFSDCFGWGIFGLQMMCGLEFVSNAYWIIEEAYRTQRIYLMVYNITTCFVTGSLIFGLFWYGNASAGNFLSASVILRELFQLGLCFFGVRWDSRLHRLQFLPFLCWLCWYAVIWPTVLNPLRRIRNCDLDCFITVVMFVTLSTSHVAVLLDTFLQRRTHQQLKQHLNVDDLPAKNLRIVVLCLSVVLVPFMLGQGIVIYSRMLHPKMWYTNLFWFKTGSTWGIQLKLIAFFFDLLVTNERALGLRHSVELLARRRCRPRQSPDVNQIQQLKQRYSQLHQTFDQLNTAYGNSLLCIFIVIFFDILFNSYWFAKQTLDRLANSAFAYNNLCFLFNLLNLLSATCWHSQQSFNHSRQIGCLIPKLVKPMGSKRYNDLVGDFLLQTLHQRFIVTAKHFFSLNLHLLSSMFAAVVTYLVILLQFMFAEKYAQASGKTNIASPSE